MHKITDSLYFRIAFNILFLAIKRKKSLDFKDWVSEKRLYNKRINRLAKKLLVSSCQIKIETRKKMLLNMASSLRLMYQLRTYIFFKFSGVKQKKILVMLAIASLHLYAYKKILISLFRLLYSYTFNSDVNKKKIIFVLGFPSHSFNYINKADGLVCSSFAEYLSSKKKDHERDKFFLVSVDEYTRRSKIFEGNRHNESHSLICEQSRYRPMRVIAPLLFCRNLFYAINLFFREHFSLSALNLLEYASRVNLIPYERLFEKVNEAVEAIYILPFSEFECMCFNQSYSKKVFTFYYSENMLIPPVKEITCMQNYLSFKEEGNFGSFGTLGNVAGFAEIPEYLKKIANMDFLANVDNSTNLKDFPSMLGFETLLDICKSEKTFVLSILDVPPESEQSQLSRSMIGDMTADIEFIDNFLSDFLKLKINFDFRIIYKPKYSFVNYTDEYRQIIESLRSKFHDKFILLDPYVRFSDVVKVSDLMVNFPFTSTCKFANNLDISSFYYIPDAYAASFKMSAERDDCFYGMDEVNNYISSLTRGLV